MARKTSSKTKHFRIFSALARTGAAWLWVAVWFVRIGSGRFLYGFPLWMRRDRLGNRQVARLQELRLDPGPGGE